MRRLSRDYLATRSRALSAAQALTTIAGWRLDADADALLRGLHDCRYEPVADLLLTPWGANTVPDLEHQLRSARCDAVLPALGKTNDGHDTMYASVALWSAAGIDWHHALRLWLAPDASGAWLVPDPEGDTPGGACFRLGRHRLRPIAEQPWEGVAKRDAGLMIANALIAAWR